MAGLGREECVITAKNTVLKTKESWWRAACSLRARRGLSPRGRPEGAVPLGFNPKVSPLGLSLQAEKVRAFECNRSCRSWGRLGVRGGVGLS